MIIPRSTLLLTCACVGFAAEQTPAPDVSSPPSATPTAMAPTATAPTATTTPTATTHNMRPVRVAEVEQLPPALRLTIIADALYDSNVLLLPDTSSGAAPTREGSADAATEARLDWRAWNSREGFLKIGGVARNDHYLEGPVDSNGRFGANVVSAWTPSKQKVIPSIALSSTRYQLDGEDIASDVFGRGAVAWRTTRSVDLVSLDVHHISYVDRVLEDRTGTLFAGSYRHWFMLAENDPAHRVELGLRGGRYIAHANTETYTTVRPDVQFTWRFGEGGDVGNLRLNVGTGLEWRHYAEPIPGQSDNERQWLSTSEAGLAYGLADSSWVGPMVGVSRRVDNIPDRTYNRWMAGIRLQIAIP